MKKVCGLACGLVVASAGLASAQVVSEVPARAVPAGVTTTQPRRVSQILGSTVQLQGKNNFGRVVDAVLDDNGAIVYLVVESNGRNVMLPWNAATVNTGQRIVTYDIAPMAVQPLFFQPNAWPNVWTPYYMAQIQRVFPRVGLIRRNVLRPVVPPATTVPPGGVIDERIKVMPNGDVKVNEIPPSR